MGNTLTPTELKPPTSKPSGLEGLSIIFLAPKGDSTWLRQGDGLGVTIKLGNKTMKYTATTFNLTTVTDTGVTVVADIIPDDPAIIQDHIDQKKDYMVIHNQYLADGLTFNLSKAITLKASAEFVKGKEVVERHMEKEISISIIPPKKF
jgi:hypothetical protein